MKRLLTVLSIVILSGLILMANKCGDTAKEITCAMAPAFAAATTAVVAPILTCENTVAMQAWWEKLYKEKAMQCTEKGEFGAQKGIICEVLVNTAIGIAKSAPNYIPEWSEFKCKLSLVDTVLPPEKIKEVCAKAGF